jgi:hypothetical protein
MITKLTSYDLSQEYNFYGKSYAISFNTCRHINKIIHSYLKLFYSSIFD